MIDKKRAGCVFMGAILFIIWIVIGWGLYHAALLAPPSPDDEDSKPFQIIPQSDD